MRSTQLHGRIDNTKKRQVRKYNWIQEITFNTTNGKIMTLAEFGHKATAIYTYPRKAPFQMTHGR